MQGYGCEIVMVHLQVVHSIVCGVTYVQQTPSVSRDAQCRSIDAQPAQTERAISCTAAAAEYWKPMYTFQQWF